MNPSQPVNDFIKNVRVLGYDGVAKSLLGCKADSLRSALKKCLVDDRLFYCYESTIHHGDPGGAAVEILEKGFRVYGEYININVDFDWGTVSGFDRSTRYKLQSWLPLDALLIADSAGLSEKLYPVCLGFSLRWIDWFIGECNQEDEFAWYDMAVGQRATKIAYLLKKALLSGEDEGTLAKLLVAANAHLLELECSERIALHSNHGLFQMLGLLALSHEFPCLSHANNGHELAVKNIKIMLRRHFMEDGLHAEHSPEYHVYMANLLNVFKDSGYICDSGLTTLINKVIHASQYLVDVNGRLLAFGDTANGIDVRTKAGFDLCFSDETYMPPEGWKWFDRTGVVVEYTYHNGLPDSCFAMMAAFHSRQHKHADDMGFVLSTRGRPLLVEAGSYKYEYAAPERIYCESTRAHNCLEIDGLNYSRYRVDGFGSAIQHAEKIGPCLVVEGEVHHKRLVPDKPYNKVVSEDAIPVDIWHRRLIFYCPSRFLLLVDILQSEDVHRYSQWLHLDPDLRVDSAVKSSDSTLIVDGDENKICAIKPLHGINKVELLSGETEPNIKGVYVDGNSKLIPMSSLRFSSSGSRQVMAVLIDMEQSEVAKVRFNEGTSGKYLRFAYEFSGRKVEFVYRRRKNVFVEVVVDGVARTIEYHVNPVG